MLLAIDRVAAVNVIGISLILVVLVVLLGWIGLHFFVQPAEPKMPLVQPGGALGAALATGPRPAVTPAIEEPEAAARAMAWLPRSVGLILLVAGCAVVGVLSLSNHIAPEPLEVSDLYRQAHIQAALNPERLVPPPALPPSLFLNSERPALESADRDWGRLNPDFVQLVLHVFNRLQERGYGFALLEGYRSPERQEKLAALGEHVTNARAFQSKHQYGLAADLAPLREGKLVISEKDPWAMAAYEALGEEAEKAGLVWGGRWSFKDYGHIEVPGKLSVSGGKNGRGAAALGSSPNQ